MSRLQELFRRPSPYNVDGMGSICLQSQGYTAKDYSNSSASGAAFSALSERCRELEMENDNLRNENDHLRNILKVAMVGHWEYDFTHKSFKWSRTMRAILELSPNARAELKTLLNRIHPDDSAEITKITEEIMLSAAANSEFCCRLLMDDGRIKWVCIHSVPEKDENGTLRTLRGTFQEIPYVRSLFPYAISTNEQIRKLTQKNVRVMPDTQVAVILALVKLSEQRDDDSFKHVERSAKYCQLLARELYEMPEHPQEVDADFIENIGWASALHDIGKVGIPDAVLLKPGSLTPREFEVMKTHVLIGCHTLGIVDQEYPGSPIVRLGMEIARYHHERWNGKGYMEKLAGENIPLGARIMAICDVYDALRSRRVYKAPISHEESVRIIKEERGKQFDPTLVDIFVKNHEAFREIFENSMDGREETKLTLI
jgi:HD-GYP domain-containing protein (c-di-GMP phosphodiesterase class II)